MGGDSHGANPNIADSQTVYVGADVQITADAVGTLSGTMYPWSGSSGSGGKVVIWSQVATEFDGAITARGGSLTGDGGSAEVSGKTELVFNGNVNLSAPHGATGTLLLDPTSINIDNTGADNAKASSGTVLAGTDPGLTYNISHTYIETLLQTTSVSLAASSSIDVQQAIDASAGGGGNSLTLIAPTITFEAGANITTNGEALSLNGNVTLNGNITLDTTNNGANAAGAAINLSAVTGGGNGLSLNAGTTGQITSTGAINNVATLTIVNSGGTTFQGMLGTGTAGAVTLTNTTGTIAFQGNTHITTLTTAASNTGNSERSVNIT